MLCSLCHHGTTDPLWVCSCAEGHCRHIHVCNVCGLRRRTLTEEGHPDGRPEDRAAWMTKRVPIYPKASKPAPTPRPKGKR